MILFILLFISNIEAKDVYFKKNEIKEIINKNCSKEIIHKTISENHYDSYTCKNYTFFIFKGVNFNKKESLYRIHVSNSANLLPLNKIKKIDEHEIAQFVLKYYKKDK